MAGLYPPLSALPLAIGILTSLASTGNTPSKAGASMNNAACSFCGTRPKYVENGKMLDYCSRTCATNANASSTGSQGPRPSQMCLACGVRPRFHDGKKLHEYCGKKCASTVTKQKMQAPQQPVQSQPCAIPACQSPAYRDKSGAVTKYCSNKHKQLSQVACLLCLNSPKRIGSFCSNTCCNKAENAAPKLLEISEDHDTFKSVSSQFCTTWKTGQACPIVRKIYKIVLTKALMSKYESYKNSVEARGNFKSVGRAAGNENRRWHGTIRSCTLGDPGNVQLCTQASCALCSIMKSSFDISKLKCGAYGAGIYSSATSSKSNGYSRNGCTSKLKAMMLSKVVVGKGAKSGYGSGLTAPPAGYDSVIVNNLGADELVVFNNDAIRPAYLLMYDA